MGSIIVHDIETLCQMVPPLPRWDARLDRTAEPPEPAGKAIDSERAAGRDENT